MEKKKLKVGQIVGIIVLVVLVIVLFWVGNIERKVRILEDLSQKVASQNAKNNVYVKIVLKEQSLEKFKKDDVLKLIARNQKENTTKIVITDSALGKTEDGATKSGAEYEEKDGKKTVKRYNEKVSFYINLITDYTDISIDPEVTAKAQVANNSKISSEKLEGKDCYVIEQSYPKRPENIVTLDIEEGVKKAKLYVEKETGLPIKEIMIYEDGHEDVKTYEYSFGTVTDEDMKAPEGYEEVEL